MTLLTCLISMFRIVITKATREITILFHQKLNGAWTNFTEYPNFELETLYAQYSHTELNALSISRQMRKWRRHL